MYSASHHHFAHDTKPGIVTVPHPKKDLAQAALARKVGVSQQQIAALESPDSNVTVGTLVKVAKALGREVAIELRRSPPAKSKRYQPA